MIGLPAITFLEREDGAGGEDRIHIERKASPVGCPRCGVVARAKGRTVLRLGQSSLVLTVETWDVSQGQRPGEIYTVSLEASAKIDTC